MKKRSTHFKYELKYIQQGYDFVVGVDEAGRGPLAGPVVAVAATIRHSEFRSKRNEESSVNNKKNRSFASTWVEAQDDGNLILSQTQDDGNLTLSQTQDDDYLKLVEALDDERFNLIRDSKLMTEKQREELYNFITEHFHVGIGICDHKTIDRINILQATYLAMKKALSSLASGVEQKAYSKKGIILVDGNKIIPNCSYEQRAIIGGDRLVKSVSAASIIAKVTRDRIMHEMHKKYPAYGFMKHKGYGTKMHREMIKKHGFCAIHRRSFKVK
jgi:ribonuclease HII